MDTKQITIDSGVLSKCGYSIKEIISYLSQFPDDAELCVCFNDGADTHGVEIESYIVQTVPMTEQEIRKESINTLEKQIKRHQESIEWYIDRNQEYRVKECKLEEKLTVAQNKLNELKAQNDTFR